MCKIVTQFTRHNEITIKGQRPIPLNARTSARKSIILLFRLDERKQVLGEAYRVPMAE